MLPTSVSRCCDVPVFFHTQHARLQSNLSVLMLRVAIAALTAPELSPLLWLPQLALCMAPSYILLGWPATYVKHRLALLLTHMLLLCLWTVHVVMPLYLQHTPVHALTAPWARCRLAGVDIMVVNALLQVLALLLDHTLLWMSFRQCCHANLCTTQFPFSGFLALQLLTLSLFFPLASLTCRALYDVHGTCGHTLRFASCITTGHHRKCIAALHVYRVGSVAGAGGYSGGICAGLCAPTSLHTPVSKPPAHCCQARLMSNLYALSCCHLLSGLMLMII